VQTQFDGNRTVLVTGAASGIGAACVRRLAGPGTRLIVHTRARADAAEAVATEARELGADAHVVLGDLALPDTPGLLVRAARQRFGGLDQIVSNAGFANRKGFGEADLAMLQAAQSAMSEAFFGLVTAALPLLTASPWARVVAITSFAAHRFSPDALYPTTAAAKAGIEAMAKALAVQLAADGVTVNCVAPGYTRKDGGHTVLSADAWQAVAARVPMGRPAEPADIAAAVGFLLSREAAYVTGAVLPVDGGLTAA